MVHRAGLFAVFAVFFATVSSRPHEESICDGKSDGIYGDPLNKNIFYICSGESPFLRMNCGKGEIFDDSLKTCTGGNEILKDEDFDAHPEENIQSEVLEMLKSSPLWEEDDVRGISKYKVYNIRVQENVFPESILAIGKANREQKNK